ncbi:MAG: hypothetical protein JWO91_3955 [Acidobacteriaceae bacterium]|nr:hypothetical protein [Acidobacteriaceae bacterium]
MLPEREVHQQQQGEGNRCGTSAYLRSSSLAWVASVAAKTIYPDDLRTSHLTFLTKSSSSTTNMLWLSCATLVTICAPSPVAIPDQNGCELAQHIRAINPGLLTIFMSGYPKHFMSRLPQQQRMFYLAKPFSASSLPGGSSTSIRGCKRRDARVYLCYSEW